jgi:TolA-binding protein
MRGLSKIIFLAASWWLLAGSASAQHAMRMESMESDFVRLTHLYELRDKSALRQLRSYLEEYPYTTFESELHFMMGVIQTERGYYKRAVKEFERSEYKDLSRAHQPEYQFYRGYAHMMQQDFERGSLYFGHLESMPDETLRKHNSKALPLKKKACYYHAYCEYKLGRYEKALPLLQSLENEPEYRKTVPYYLVQIYYSQGDDEAVRSKAEQLLDEQPDNANNGELHRMLGEIYFRQGRYRDAVRELKAYDEMFTSQKMEVLRNDLYLLGVAQIKTEDYRGAIGTFKRVKEQNDEISENVSLSMGNAYVQAGELEQAKLSYLAATRYNINERVHYEAMYNYCLAVYQSSTSIGESETVFTDFIRQYPNSDHVNEVYLLLSDAFRKAKNYKAALSALDSVKTVPGQESVANQIAETKQYLRYQVGSDAYVRGRFAEARDWFTAVVEDKGLSSLVTDAYYWCAEANYRLGDYAAVLNDLNLFFARADAGESPNRVTADYLRGYAYFQQKEYEAARAAFASHIAGASPSSATYQDALNRLGDCYFNARMFTEASSYYEKAAGLNTSTSDYALFQQGYSLGLQRRYEEKIKVLQQLSNRYPKSDYADDALYEIGRVRLTLEQEREAAAAYEQLLERYPRSNKARSASLERAMAYRNIHDYAHAIEAYKYTIERYPASQEAYIAVEGLEAVYVETNRVNEFVEYSKRLGKLNMQVTTKDDSLAYAAAELQYRQGNIDAALAQYLPLSQRVGSPYAESSAMTAASIYYERQDYANAMTQYRQMLALSSKRKNALAARTGILNCAVAQHDTKEIINIASQILGDEPVAADVREEALYQRGKAYRESKQYGLSVPDFDAISKDVRTSIGAEAKYLLAQSYFDLKAYDTAESEVMSFAQQPTQQQYWLARSLILLSEISHERGDDFQSKQYLLSLKANYKNSDDILQRVDEHLQALDAADETNQTTNDEEEKL